MYDPVTGRYTQPDPLRFIDGSSIYAYAGSSPYIKTDREGLKVINSGQSWGNGLGGYSNMNNPSGGGGSSTGGQGWLDWLMPPPPQSLYGTCMAKKVDMTVSCNVYPVGSVSV